MRNAILDPNARERLVQDAARSTGGVRHEAICKVCVTYTTRTSGGPERGGQPTQVATSGATLL